MDHILLFSRKHSASPQLHLNCSRGLFQSEGVALVAPVYCFNIPAIFLGWGSPSIRSPPPHNIPPSAASPKEFNATK